MYDAVMLIEQALKKTNLSHSDHSYCWALEVNWTNCQHCRLGLGLTFYFYLPPLVFQQRTQARTWTECFRMFRSEEAALKAPHGQVCLSRLPHLVLWLSGVSDPLCLCVFVVLVCFFSILWPGICCETSERDRQTDRTKKKKEATIQSECSCLQ